MPGQRAARVEPSRQGIRCQGPAKAAKAAKAREGDGRGQKRPRRDRRRQLPARHRERRPPARRRGPGRGDRHHRIPQDAARRPSGTGSGDSAPASRVKNSRTRPAEARNRRSLPRTVSSGTPDAAAIDRNPCPRAARASMSPITAVPSHRRASTHAGRRTCVARHEPHRALRGRTLTGTRPAVKTRRGTAWPHPPSRPPQPGHENPPLRRRSSATAVLLPTVSNGASKHLTALPELRQRSRGGPACNRHAHGVVARHPTATRTTTKPALTSNDATTPTGVTLNGG